MSLAPSLLIAAPPLGDPNFDHSVVLLAAHGPEGAFGWVVNGRELMSMSELLARADITATSNELPGHVRVGGPVSPEQVWLIYRTRDRFTELDGQFEVSDGITASASRKVLEALALSPSQRDVFALVGYAGWAPTQLEEEIRAGAWLPTDVDTSLVCEVAREQVWHSAYARICANPMGFMGKSAGSA
jgi:putative transcriptional regulator